MTTRTAIPTPPPATPVTTASPPVSNAVDAVKVYGAGDDRGARPRRRHRRFPRRRFTAIMGPSGSGKSTLMHCLAGLDTLTSGQVLHRRHRARRALRQASSPCCAASASASCSRPSTWCRRSPPTRTSPCRSTLAGARPDRGWFDTVVDTVGSATGCSHRPSELSGGQQQRVAVARALVEPARDRLRRRADRQPRLARGRRDPRLPAPGVDELGQTIVMVTHDPVAAGYADSVRVPRRRPHRRRACDRARPPSGCLDRMQAARRLRPPMFEAHAQEPPGPTSAGWSARSSRCSRRAVPAGTLVLGDTLRPNFDDLFTEANAAPMSSCAATARSTAEFDADPAGAASTRPRRRRSRRSTASPRPSPTSRASARSSAPTASRSAATGPPHARRQLDRRRRPQPVPASSRDARPSPTNEVVIDRGAADDGDLEVGDTTTVLTPEPVEVDDRRASPRSATRTASAASPSPPSPSTAPQQHLPTTPAQVTSIAGRGRRRRVARTSSPTASRPSLPDGVEAITGAELTDGEQRRHHGDFLDFFTTFLVVFAGDRPAGRRRSASTTPSRSSWPSGPASRRCCGRSARPRRQILASVVVEALVRRRRGVGHRPGRRLGAGRAAEGDVRRLRLRPARRRPRVRPSTTIVVGAGRRCRRHAGRRRPARPAGSRVAPLAALRETSPSTAPVPSVAPGRRRRRCDRRPASPSCWSACSATAAPCSARRARRRCSHRRLVVLGPVVARPVEPGARRPAPRLRGVTGQLARENAMRNPRRTAGTAAALMVGVAVVTLFTVFAASIKASIDEHRSAAVRRRPRRHRRRLRRRWPQPELADAASSTLPEVEPPPGSASAPARIDGDDRVQSRAADPAAARPRSLDLDVTDGSLDRAGRRRSARRSPTTTAEPRHGLGDTVPSVPRRRHRRRSRSARSTPRRRWSATTSIAPTTWAAHAAQRRRRQS